MVAAAVTSSQLGLSNPLLVLTGFFSWRARRPCALHRRPLARPLLPRRVLEAVVALLFLVGAALLLLGSEEAAEQEGATEAAAAPPKKKSFFASLFSTKEANAKPVIAEVYKEFNKIFGERYASPYFTEFMTDDAEIVLVGVSRCGKTPASLYLALQFGIYAANYPLVEEDFASLDLPKVLKPLHNKLHGLTIAPARLHQIRDERAPGSHYASLENCRLEVLQAQNMMTRFGIPYLNVTTMSVEEIATTIVHLRSLKRE